MRPVHSSADVGSNLAGCATGGGIMTDARYHAKAEPFGRWLIAQRDRGDWMDALAHAARSDRSFPKDGDPEAVRAYLRQQQADGDTFQVVDDAESAWMSL